MKENTIFVSIGSFRDKICPKTLESIYKNATRPNLVFVGICQQNAITDIDCLEIGLKDIPQYKNNVRIIRLSNDQARGPTYARFLCSTLHDGEEYYLQIDSHCRFVKDWDTFLIGMIQDLKKSGVNKCVLSHYTPNYDDYKERPNPNSPVSTICQAWFTDQNLISLLGAGWVEPDKLPRPNAYIAAGMFFCESKFLKELPFDPELDFLFIGEELLLSARFYTHGWDIFTPNRNTIFHLYTREKEPKFWENQHNDSDQASKKVRFLLGLDTDPSKLTARQLHLLDRYGLGKERTLDDYYNFAGIDVKQKKVLKNMCEHQTKSPDERNPHKEHHKHNSNIMLWIINILLLSLIIIIFYSTFNF